MMLGIVLAALYASPTTVPIATPMMRVRRKPVARDAIVPSAMLRLVRSAPAGVADLPPIDRRLPGRPPEASDRRSGRLFTEEIFLGPRRLCGSNVTLWQPAEEARQLGSPRSVTNRGGGRGPQGTGSSGRPDRPGVPLRPTTESGGASFLSAR